MHTEGLSFDLFCGALVRPSMGVGFLRFKAVYKPNLVQRLPRFAQWSKGGPRNCEMRLLPSIHQRGRRWPVVAPDDARIRNAKTRCFPPSEKPHTQRLRVGQSRLERRHGSDHQERALADADGSPILPGRRSHQARRANRGDGHRSGKQRLATCRMAERVTPASTIR